METATETETETEPGASRVASKIKFGINQQSRASIESELATRNKKQEKWKCSRPSRRKVKLAAGERIN